MTQAAPKGLAGIGIGLALATQVLAFGPIAGALVTSSSRRAHALTLIYRISPPP